MKKRKYIFLGIALLAALGGCGSDKSGEGEKRAEKSNEKVSEMESEETFVFKEEDGAVVLTKYNGKDSDVEIPDEYDGKKVTAIADTAFADYGQIKSITIPYTIQEIDRDTLPDNCSITLNVYRNTMGQQYAYYRSLTFNLLGDNPAQASKVTIYNKEGVESEQLSLGAAPKGDFLKGVSFREIDGKSVLSLNNCDIGGIAVEEYASLTIQLEEYSANTVTGARGNDGISVLGNLTITGEGSLQVYGSDVYTVREGEAASVGFGITTYGNLTIDNHVELMAKAGTSRSRASMGICVNNGNLIVNGSKIEAYAGMDESVIYPAVMIYGDSQQTGRLELNNVQIAEGGSLLPVNAADGGITDSYVIGTGPQVTYDEDYGLEGAANYVRIEPQAQN